MDLAVITVPAKAVAGIFEDCGAKGVHYAVVTSGGFREMGEQGREMERHIIELARRYRIRFIGPNCLGILNPHHHLNLTMFSYRQSPGTMGLASQSGYRPR